MSIASLNVNGLRGHLDEVVLLLKSRNIHILALNETKLDPLYPEDLTMVAGYQQIRHDRTCNGGGVSIYIRESLKFKPRNDVPVEDLELICIEVEPPKCRSFFVVAWYRPPSDLVGTFDRLEKVLSFLDKEEKEIILLGDTNCDLTKTSAEQPVNNDAKNICSLYGLFSLSQLIVEPTRVTPTTSTIIDHVATTDVKNIVESGVLQISMSDHYMVYCIRKFRGGVEKNHKMITTRSMKYFEENAFLSDVAGICWENALSQTDDIDVLVKDFSELFSLIIDKHAPIKSLRVSERYCPWINKGLRELMRDRDKLKKTAVKSGSPNLMSAYRQLRNKVNKMNVELKRQYFSDKILQFEGNMKDSWKTINQLLNKRSKSTNIDILEEAGRNVSNKQEIAETMNGHFCSIGKDLASIIEETPNPLLTGEYELNPMNKRFHFKSINVLDIGDAIGKLKTAISFGNDNISSYFLKLALPLIENSLVLLFNTSIETGRFPDSWKTARVTPIFKDGDKTNKSNYRPISVLPVISRLFEKLIFNQLYRYLNQNGLLSENQSGFRELHSTVTCLLKNTDDWYSELDNGHLLGLVFIDLKKAFDTVDHQLLCKKLQHYGVCQRELAWFESYLTNRKQFCRIGGVDSNTEKIEVGVPQGSCLGPLLFLVYINDLPRGVKNSVTTMYADDTSVCYRSKSITQLNEAINGDLRSLDTWLKGNKLSLNVTKTQSMLICTRPKRKALEEANLILELNICDTAIDNAPKTKYLGVHIDGNLNWKEHIKAVSSKVSRAIGFLKYAKKFLPLATVIKLYTSIVEPHFRYCCSVWGCCGVTEIKKLQKLQNRAARILTNSSYDTPSRPLIDKLGWKTLEKLICDESKTMVYKSLHKLAPQYLCDLFTRNSVGCSRNLRNTATDLRLPMKNSQNGQKCFSYRGARLWNGLSAESKTAPSLNVFKQSI